MPLVAIQPNVKSDGRYTIKETVVLLGLCRKQLYNEMNAGNLKFRLNQKATQRRITGAEIVRYWKCNT